MTPVFPPSLVVLDFDCHFVGIPLGRDLERRRVISNDGAQDADEGSKDESGKRNWLRHRVISPRSS
jgi:hypothetical protein